MANPPINEAVKQYLTLMEEAKVRFNVINYTHQNAAGFAGVVVREICYLQFRFLCEIIALACLAAHGDLHETKSLHATYEPGKILKRLEKLNPHFYPIPMEIREQPGGRSLIGRPDIKHLSKAELPKLWAITGDILHRSPMVKYLDTRAPKDFADIFDWAQKLTGLLNTHWITLVENQKGMLVSLSEAPTGKAVASLFTFNIDGSVNTAEVSILRVS